MTIFTKLKCVNCESTAVTVLKLLSKIIINKNRSRHSLLAHLDIHFRGLVIHKVLFLTSKFQILVCSFVFLIQVCYHSYHNCTLSTGKNVFNYIILNFI